MSGRPSPSRTAVILPHGGCGGNLLLAWIRLRDIQGRLVPQDERPVSATPGVRSRDRWIEGKPIGILNDLATETLVRSRCRRNDGADGNYGHGPPGGTGSSGPTTNSTPKQSPSPSRTRRCGRLCGGMSVDRQMGFRRPPFSVGRSSIKTSANPAMGIVGVIDHGAATLDVSLPNRPAWPLPCIGLVVVPCTAADWISALRPGDGQPTRRGSHRRHPAVSVGSRAVRQEWGFSSSSSSPPRNSAGVQISSCPNPRSSSKR